MDTSWLYLWWTVHKGRLNTICCETLDTWSQEDVEFLQEIISIWQKFSDNRPRQCGPLSRSRVKYYLWAEQQWLRWIWKWVVLQDHLRIGKLETLTSSYQKRRLHFTRLRRSLKILYYISARFAQSRRILEYARSNHHR